MVPVDREMGRPTIHHPDLAPGNIIISDSSEITGIIDWHHCTVLPPFWQAKITKSLFRHTQRGHRDICVPHPPEKFRFVAWGKELDPHAHRARLCASARTPWETEMTYLNPTSSAPLPNGVMSALESFAAVRSIIRKRRLKIV